MRDSVRIGIDARFILRPLRGIPLYTLKLCTLLPKQFPNEKFIFFINKRFEHNETYEICEKRLNKIKVFKNVTIVNKDDEGDIKWEQYHLPRLLKKYSVDILHMPANRICYFTRIPIITTLHDLMEYHFLCENKIEPSSGLKRWFYDIRMKAYVWAMYNWGLKKSKQIITVSDYSKQDIQTFFAPDKFPVTAIYHGLESEFCPVDTKGFSGRKFILMLGGDSYHKNPEGAIKAYSKLSTDLQDKYPLKVIGFCGDKQSRLYQALMKTGLIDKVILKNWVSQKEIVDCFQRAAVFIYMSRFEGFGFPILQAMACGTPVITSNKASIPEVIENTGFKLDPDDHQGVSEKITNLLLDEEEWLKQCNLGIERAKHFSWEKCIKAHMDVYLRSIHC